MRLMWMLQLSIYGLVRDYKKLKDLLVKVDRKKW